MSGSNASELNSGATESGDNGNAWVLATKQVGDIIAGWRVEQRFNDNVRLLESSERCNLTAFCYPTGAKLVRARLFKAETS